MREKTTLTRADIKVLRRMIRYEFKCALVREIDVVRAPRPGEDGSNMEPSVEKLKTSVLDWFVSYLPYIEGALRGMQDDIVKTNNLVTGDMLEGLRAMRDIMAQNEKHFKNLIALGQNIAEMKQLVDKSRKRIELIESDNITRWQDH